MILKYFHKSIITNIITIIADPDFLFFLFFFGCCFFFILYLNSNKLTYTALLVSELELSGSSVA